MKKLISILSAICLCTAIFTATVSAEEPKLPEGFSQITYSDEEVIELFGKYKEDGSLEKNIARILKESGKDGSVTIGSPVELKRVNLGEKKLLRLELPAMLLPVSQNGELLGAVKIAKVLAWNGASTSDDISHYTFKSENFSEDLANPDEEIALFALSYRTPEYANGVFGIDRNGKRFAFYQYSDSPADISGLTFEEVTDGTNILTSKALEQNSDFVYNKTVDITLGAGVEEPVY